MGFEFAPHLEPVQPCRPYLDDGLTGRMQLILAAEAPGNRCENEFHGQRLCTGRGERLQCNCEHL